MKSFSINVPREKQQSGKNITTQHFYGQIHAYSNWNTTIEQFHVEIFLIKQVNLTQINSKYSTWNRSIPTLTKDFSPNKRTDRRAIEFF